MIRTVHKLAIGTMALALSAGLAFAQGTPAPAAGTAPAAKSAAPAAAPTAASEAAASKGKKEGKARKQAKTPEGQACSDEADAKSLKGAERKTFRKACMTEKRQAAKAAAKGAAPASAAAPAPLAKDAKPAVPAAKDTKPADKKG